MLNQGIEEEGANKKGVAKSLFPVWEKPVRVGRRSFESFSPVG